MAFNPNTTAEAPSAAPAAQAAGEAPPRRRAAAKVVNLPRSPDFRLKFHPARWEFTDGEWLPQLGKLKLEGGIGGVDGRLNEGAARENCRQIGWQVLDQDALGEEYVIRYPVRGGFAHLERWISVKHMPGNLPASCKPDMKAYNAWRRSLIERSIIPAIDPDVKAGFVEIKQTEVERLRNRAEHDPIVADRLAENEAVLAAMMGEAPTPKPKRRKRRATKKKTAPKVATEATAPWDEDADAE
jgi:hypothetical protein